MRKKVFLMILFFMNSIAISACSVISQLQVGPAETRKELKEKWEPVLQSEFKELGFTGKVTVIDARAPFGQQDSIFYRYEEVVEGRKIVFTDQLDVDVVNNCFESFDYDNFFFVHDFPQSVASFIVIKGMWQQTYVQNAFKMFSKKLDDLEDKKLKLEGIDGHFTRLSRYEKYPELSMEEAKQAQSEIATAFKNSRKRNLVLNGYYNVNIPHYLSKHALEVEIEYFWEDYNRSDAAAKDCLQRKIESLKKIDYTGFWDGFYVIRFVANQMDSHSPYTLSEMVLEIQDGKLVRTIKLIDNSSSKR